MEYNRNFYLALVLSMLVMFGWLYFFGPQPGLDTPVPPTQVAQIQEAIGGDQGFNAGTTGTATARNHIPGGAGNMSLDNRASAIALDPRIIIDTPNLQGSINLNGALIDDLQLKNYRETVDPNSPLIALLNPLVFKQGYLAEFRYLSGDTNVTLPTMLSSWQIDGDNTTLTPTTPVKLIFDNGEGLIIRRMIAVDDQFMFRFTDEVSNETGGAVALDAYSRVVRVSRPDTESGNYLLHEGLIGSINAQVETSSYSDLDGATGDDRIQNFATSQGGFVGITDKYWAVAAIPALETEHRVNFVYGDNPGTYYIANYRALPVTIAAGSTQKFEGRIFAGAKQVDILNAYADAPGQEITQFGFLIDWGWFKFLTQPMFVLIDWLYRLVGNFGLAILLVTVILKAVLFPLANKSYKSMARMKKLQPAMVEIREKYSDDRQKQQQAIMQLYRDEKVNPLAGCWPILIQFPIFFALYKVLYITIEMRHAPFFGWIQDLAAPDPTSLFNLFGLLPYEVPALLMIGVWPLLMGLTMFLQMRMNPTPPDPTQAMIFNWMPLIFTFTLSAFPAGLVIYWAWNNALSILQQGIIMKSQGVKIELVDNLKTLFKKKPKKEK